MVPGVASTSIHVCAQVNTNRWADTKGWAQDHWKGGFYTEFIAPGVAGLPRNVEVTIWFGSNLEFAPNACDQSMQVPLPSCVFRKSGLLTHRANLHSYGVDCTPQIVGKTGQTLTVRISDKEEVSSIITRFGCVRHAGSEST
jgi:hypothetical protein